MGGVRTNGMMHRAIGMGGPDCDEIEVTVQLMYPVLCTLSSVHKLDNDTHDLCRRLSARYRVLMVILSGCHPDNVCKAGRSLNAVTKRVYAVNEARFTVLLSAHAGIPPDGFVG